MHLHWLHGNRYCLQEVGNISYNSKNPCAQRSRPVFVTVLLESDICECSHSTQQETRPINPKGRFFVVLDCIQFMLVSFCFNRIRLSPPFFHIFAQNLVTKAITTVFHDAARFNLYLIPHFKQPEHGWENPKNVFHGTRAQYVL